MICLASLYPTPSDGPTGPVLSMATVASFRAGGAVVSTVEKLIHQENGTSA